MGSCLATMRQPVKSPVVTSEFGFDWLSELGCPVKFNFTSKIVGPGKKFEDVQLWTNNAWLSPHEAIRYMCDTLCYCCDLPTMDPTEVAKIEAFEHLFTVAHIFIFAHQAGEDVKLAEIMPDWFGSSTRTGADHKAMTVMLADIETSIKKAKDEAKAGEKASPKKYFGDASVKLKELKAHMDEHLAEEEEVFPAAAEKLGWDEGKFFGWVFGTLLPYEGEASAPKFKELFQPYFGAGMIIVFSGMAVWRGKAETAAAMALAPPMPDDDIRAMKAAATAFWVDPLKTIIGK